MEKIRPLHYSISETPPFHLLGLFGLQQALLSVSAPLGVSIVVAEVVCAQKDEVIKAQILSASMLMCGVATFLMNTFGVRLPIFQGPTSMYIVPLLVMSSSPEWQCPGTYESINPVDNSSILLTVVGNNTAIPARQMILTKISRVMISLVVGWAFSGILTASGFFSDDPTSKEFLARTDAKGDIISRASVFDVPYPGKLGGLAFSTAGFLSFFIATLLSVLDSIGDYSACARTARVPPLPRFAFNRGIAVEGLATILSGSLGCCHASVSYGGNIGAMGITGVASRRVFQLCGIIYVLCAVVGKIGAFFITIPLPVLGGTSLVMMGLFIGMVLSYLETINLRSTRNLAIIGMALLLGLIMPYWVTNNPEGINTGSEQVDTLIKILLSNPSFVGGFFACAMDNSVPGTLKDRGLLEQMKELDGESSDLSTEKSTEYMEGREVYRLPFIPQAFRRSKVAKIFPMFDTVSK
ncbi:solute carrier family 23 member 2 [Elysia marginata]|uniref:Solute carrier family 23 member 2 n=1 Tax=Elysia marginata TaxID=1093978 RepID=A0AAV4ICR3_9GAST|nr:solute carrier family 23 member 2 [Elysia marginata]